MTYEEYHNLAAEEGELAAYAQATSLDWAQHLYALPPRMRGGLVRWVLFGIRPGDFLCAVLSNDLMAALGRADDVNKNLLWEVGLFLHNGCPGECWGSRDLFNNWKGMFPQ